MKQERVNITRVRIQGAQTTKLGKYRLMRVMGKAGFQFHAEHGAHFPHLPHTNQRGSEYPGIDVEYRFTGNGVLGTLHRLHAMRLAAAEPKTALRIKIVG